MNASNRPVRGRLVIISDVVVDFLQPSPRLGGPDYLSAASMDFFAVGTLTGRVLFIVVVLSHHRRRIVHLNMTHPTAAWAAQQVVEAFPYATAPRWIHRDRDRIYGPAFRRRLAGMGIVKVFSAPASPWQNPYVERVVGSTRRECLDHVIVVNESHLRRVLTSYLRYYHGSRAHLGREKDAPDRRPVAQTSIGLIIAVPEVGSLHHRYERRAA
jgi:putative transposase